MPLMLHFSIEFHGYVKAVMILYRNMTLPLSYTLVLTNTPLNIDRMIEQCQSQEPRVQGGQTQQIA